MKKAFAFILIVVFVSACSMIGIHFKLHNPKRAGSYPEKTEALDLLGDQESGYRTCFDVKHYHLFVHFEEQTKYVDNILGIVTLDALAVQDCDTIQLDLAENLKLIGGIATWQDKQYKTYRKAGALFVVLNPSIPAGSQFHLQITYSGNPPDAKRPPWRGGFVRKKDDLDHPWQAVACQTEGASMWWPCKDVVNDEPDSVDIDFVVDTGLVAVSNGQLISVQPAVGSEKSKLDYHWHVSYPINLYDITFYIGKYKLLHDDYISEVTGDTLPLNHYVLVQHYDKAKEHFKQLKEHLAVYEELFGPYPFYRDGFKLVESPYAGMEHQTAIAYGNKFKNNYLGFDYIILHETAHEWWGNSLTAYDLAEGWLHEGFATYAECLYVEKKLGYQAYLDYLRTYRWTIINRHPVIGPYGMRYFNYKDGDIYTKGAWILHTLRQTISKDSVFFDIIKTFATRYAYRNVTSKDFISVVNEKTGEDYQWFFDQYLYNRFVPELDYCQDGDRLYYMWNRDYVSREFSLPVVVKVGLSEFDTLVPWNNANYVDCHKDFPIEFVDQKLVKYTEDKSVRRSYMRGIRDF